MSNLLQHKGEVWCLKGKRRAFLKQLTSIINSKQNAFVNCHTVMNTVLHQILTTAPPLSHYTISDRLHWMNNKRHWVPCQHAPMANLVEREDFAGWRGQSSMIIGLCLVSTNCFPSRYKRAWKKRRNRRTCVYQLSIWACMQRPS